MPLVPLLSFPISFTLTSSYAFSTIPHFTRVGFCPVAVVAFLQAFLTVVFVEISNVTVLSKCVTNQESGKPYFKAFTHHVKMT